MKDIYKNPTFYHLLVPIIVALWPLLIWAVYLPDAKDNLSSELTDYQKAQGIMLEILKLDPDRLVFSENKAAATEFEYATAVEQVASLCRIPSTNYQLSSGMVVTSSGQKSQSAKVSLKEVDIVGFAKFLSTLELRWANLQCDRIKLTKKKGLPDVWDADLDFKYYY